MTTIDPTTVEQISQAPAVADALRSIETALAGLDTIEDVNVAAKALIQAVCVTETDVTLELKRASNLTMGQVREALGRGDEIGWTAVKHHMTAATRPRKLDLENVHYDDVFGAA